MIDFEKERAKLQDEIAALRTKLVLAEKDTTALHAARRRVEEAERSAQLVASRMSTLSEAEALNQEKVKLLTERNRALSEVLDGERAAHASERAAHANTRAELEEFRSAAAAEAQAAKARSDAAMNARAMKAINRMLNKEMQMGWEAFHECRQRAQWVLNMQHHGVRAVKRMQLRELGDGFQALCDYCAAAHHSQHMLRQLRAVGRRIKNGGTQADTTATPAARKRLPASICVLALAATPTCRALRSLTVLDEGWTAWVEYYSARLEAMQLHRQVFRAASALANSELKAAFVCWTHVLEQEAIKTRLKRISQRWLFAGAATVWHAWRDVVRESRALARQSAQQEAAMATSSLEEVSAMLTSPLDVCAALGETLDVLRMLEHSRDRERAEHAQEVAAMSEARHAQRVQHTAQIAALRRANERILLEFDAAERCAPPPPSRLLACAPAAASPRDGASALVISSGSRHLLGISSASPRHLLGTGALPWPRTHAPWLMLGAAPLTGSFSRLIGDGESRASPHVSWTPSGPRTTRPWW